MLFEGVFDLIQLVSAKKMFEEKELKNVIQGTSDFSLMSHN